jgi:hypothetical protein
MAECIYEEFCRGVEPRALFATIYISEAHASDDWRLPPPIAQTLGEGANIKLARKEDERIDAAKRFQKRFTYSPSLYIDNMQDEAMDIFSAWPERAYIFERGVCVYQGGKGPFDFDMTQVQTWLRQKFD